MGLDGLTLPRLLLEGDLGSATKVRRPEVLTVAYVQTKRFGGETPLTNVVVNL